MLTIYKFELAIRDIAEVTMPPSANVLSVGEQDGKLFLWAEVDDVEIGLTFNRKEGGSLYLRRFRVAGTGHPIDVGMKLGRFIGTVQMKSIKAVWHVYEEGK